MHIRRLLVRSLHVISLLATPSLWAQTPAVPPAPVPQTLEDADAQRARAVEMRRSADTLYTTDQAACYKKFLVSDCLAEAKKRHTQSLIDARNVESPARDFQRDVKRAEVAAKEAKRDAEQPARDADQKAHAESFRTDETAKAANRERKLTANAQKAEKGRQKTAAEQAKRHAKLEKRAKQDAERAAKKARGAAKTEAKAVPKK